MSPSQLLPADSRALWNQKVLYGLAFLLVLRSLFLAFYVIPPADTPDESGHYAYVRDIAAGEFFPVLGKAIIPNNLWLDVKAPNPFPRTNYIVQHPPLYYAVAAVPLFITQQFTQERWYQIRVTRSVSALSLGLLFLVLFKTLSAAGIEPRRAVLSAIVLAFIPMISDLSAGISNDIFLFLLCALATLYLVRFLRQQQIADAYRCAIWLTLAGGTKMTAWPLIGVFLIIMVYEMRQPVRRWLMHSVALGTTAMLLPAWWMARNYHYFGNMFKVDTGSHAQELFEKLSNYSLLQYLREQPYLDWMLVHFYGLFGFAGYCQSLERIAECIGPRQTRIANQAFEVFVGLLLVIAVIYLVHGVRRYLQHLASRPEPLRANPLQTLSQGLLGHRWLKFSVPSLIGLMALLAFAYGMQITAYEAGYLGYTAKVVMMSLILIAALHLCLLFVEDDMTERLIAYGPVLLLLFATLFTVQAHKGYQLTGELRGVQGRYFYPFLPLLLTSLALLFERVKVPTVVLMWAVIALAWGEMFSYVTQVIPFMEFVRL
ncbi:MAG: glycosyltransferase family 39 protein [Pseudomonas sp.]|nr:glycosyltransferase family 39 protein [Pseudomonas sp.]